ncbi:MAG: potassium channel protein [Acidimicrobiia bacterium]|nr:potassium channel protein [Acidimicrobiia bacterium]
MAMFGKRQRKRIDRRNPWGRFRTGLALLVLVLIVGSIGYMLLGLNFGDAVYQTVITVSTVGYREVGDVDRQFYKEFTVGLILFGTGTVLYTIGVLLETIFEGQLDDQFRRQRMQRKIDQLEGHVIVCGYGQVGRSIVDEMHRAGRDVVVVDREDLDLDELPDGILVVLGEATEDAVLVQAGIARAQTLVVALDSDADNLFVALTARTENESLFIISRANSSGVVEKLQRVGVDRVVNPHEIGGSRMAAMVLQPGVTDFLDVVMHDGALEVRMAEIEATPRSGFVGRTVSDAITADLAGTTIVAIRRRGNFLTSPSAELRIEAADMLIVLGTDEHLHAMAKAAEG